MIYSIDGKIVSIDGNVFERKVKSLTYQNQAGWFPWSYYNFNRDPFTSNIINDNEVITIESFAPNRMTVNYGDGNSASVDFKKDGNRYRAGWRLDTINGNGEDLLPQHQYTDDYRGLRNVTLEFENPEVIRRISFSFIKLFRSLPIEVNYFKGLENLSYSYASEVEVVPDSFPPNLTHYTLSNALQSKLLQFQDSLFETDLSTLSVSNSINLSDNISSNFFKINQLKNTITNLEIERCDIVEFPESIQECTLINDLRAGNNDFDKIPEEVNSLVNLTRLYLSSSDLTDTSIPVWDNLKELRNLIFSFPQSNLSDILDSWKFLYSLNEFLTTGFVSLIPTNTRFDEFISYWYQLITENASVTQDSGEFLEYPNRFRNISWGHSSLSFTGAKVAPSGYVQGISNGTPVTSGEKAYVLQNQYGHVITHAEPII